MAITVQNIYNQALAIMGEDSDEEYTRRTPGIINTLLARVFPISESYVVGTPHSAWTPVSAMADEVVGVDQSLALAAMPYGLAALLTLDEDPARSNSWWGLFTDNCEMFKRQPTAFEPIEDVYNVTDEYEEFSRWG